MWLNVLVIQCACLKSIQSFLFHFIKGLRNLFVSMLSHWPQNILGYLFTASVCLDPVNSNVQRLQVFWESSLQCWTFVTSFIPTNFQRCTDVVLCAWLYVVKPFGGRFNTICLLQIWGFWLRALIHLIYFLYQNLLFAWEYNFIHLQVVLS